LTQARVYSILVVNGDEPTLAARSELLRSGGFDVLEARNGQQALKLLNHHKPHLVLVEVDLPDMSGLDVSHEIKTDPRLDGVKVILCSAIFNTPRDQLHGLETGKADVYLNTPVKPGELIAVAGRLLNARRGRPRRSRGTGR
jgi:CheY-like chemotaxis protein